MSKKLDSTRLFVSSSCLDPPFDSIESSLIFSALTRTIVDQTRQRLSLGPLLVDTRVSSRLFCPLASFRPRPNSHVRRFDVPASHLLSDLNARHKRSHPCPSARPLSLSSS
jgi:hypothetical protein